MKKIFLLLGLLVNFITFAQGFPVDISGSKAPQSMMDVIVQDGTAVSGDLGSASYTVAATTVNTNVIQVAASEVGGFNLYIKTLSVRSTKDANLKINITQGSGFLGTVPATADRVFSFSVKAGVRYDLPINAQIVWGAKIFLFVENFTDTTGNAVINFQHDSYKFFLTTDFFAGNTMMGIGDSIMKGVGTTYTVSLPYLSHFALLSKYYLDLGFRLRPINKGVPGATIEDIAALVRAGYYNTNSNLRIIYFSIGTNVSPSNASFTTSLNEILAYFQTHYPNTKVLVCAPPARLDIKELTVAQYRPIMQSAVTALANPNFTYLDFSLSFNASDPANGIIMGDYNTGVGGDVHPNNTGQLAMFNYVKPIVISNNIYPLK